MCIRDRLDGVSAMLMVGALGAAAALAFARGCSDAEARAVVLPSWLRMLLSLIHI